MAEFSNRAIIAEAVQGRLLVCSLFRGGCNSCPVKTRCEKLYDQYALKGATDISRAESYLRDFEGLVSKWLAK